ncbi:F-box/FBD/LRR-repeat protein At4g26340-like [Cajanus cajan]|uniref:FBD-associated F-box protein At2g26860 family n=1 Tax=Cajanus cajan TaxID=3821 RepID=A0A151S3P8_CAJCA|nr:F-box/FBD/LRR-repeat protein At4g26340-like [Cajanus cajan]KYP49419.1 FBD-associated F-box protein At2g26860 family [Cajanus cajan]
MVPSLHIECPLPIMNHYKTLNAFLALRRTQKITSFHLKCNSYDDCCPRYVEQWISEVVAKKVEQVNISMSLRSALDVTAALFTCATIVNMKLEGSFSIIIPSSVHLPNLKTLHLNILACFGILNVNKLFSGSPTLQRFYLKRLKYFFYFKELMIVRNSRYIQLLYCNSLYDILIQYDRDYDFIPDSMQIHRWPNIDKAKVYLTLSCDMEETACNILRGLCNVEFLSLKCFRDHINPSTLDLPLFKNLVELRLFLKKDDSLIKELPAKCPKLQVTQLNILDDRPRRSHNISGRTMVHDLSILI